MFTDEQDIDRTLKAALDVRPSADFEAGVRSRIEQERSTVRRGAWPAWLAAAAVIVLVAGGWLVVRDAEVQPEPQQAEHVPAPAPAPSDPAPAVTLPASPVVAEAAPEAPLREDRAAVPPRMARRAEPEVIVPANQIELIQRLLRDVEAGRVEMPKPEAVAAAPAQLSVPPVAVDPIPVPSLDPDVPPAPPVKGLK